MTKIIFRNDSNSVTVSKELDIETVNNFICELSEDYQIETDVIYCSMNETVFDLYKQKLTEDLKHKFVYVLRQNVSLGDYEVISK